jgi:hypothetical protein
MTYQVDDVSYITSTTSNVPNWAVFYRLAEHTSSPTGVQDSALVGEDFPILVRIWDNEEDAIFDEEQ